MPFCTDDPYKMTTGLVKMTIKKCRFYKVTNPRVIKSEILSIFEKRDHIVPMVSGPRFKGRVDIL